MAPRGGVSGTQRTSGVALVLALGFGCGGDGGGGSPTTPAPPAPSAPQPPPTPPPPPPPQAPATPTGLRVSANTADSITWTWDPVEGATAYDVQLSADEVFDDTDAIVTTAETSYTVTGLSAESGRHLRVRAVAGTADAPAVSAWSSHVTGMSAMPPPPPAPAGLHVSATTPDSITWTWTAVGGATAYEVQVSADEVFDDTDAIATTTETSYTVTGLSPESGRHLRVRAVAGTVEAPVPSAWSSHVTGMSAMPPPPVPTGLQVSATTPDSITWTWIAVEGARAYDVQISSDEVFDDTDAIATTMETSHTVTGLSPESGRHLRVRAVAGTVEAPVPSAWSSHVTGMSAMPPPPVPTGLQVSATTPDSITWTWIAVEGARAYDVQISSDEVFDDTDAIATTMETSHTVTGLSPDSGRHLRVRAVAGTATAPVRSAWSRPVAGMSAMPPPPLALAVCERTPQVRDAILWALSLTDCSAVTAAQLQNVYRLELHDQNIMSLQPGDFGGLGNLRRLGLRQNALTTLPSDVFQGLENLRYLDLQQNSLVELPAGIFGGLGKLTYLSLRRNELTTLPGDVFKGLSQMTELPLGHNSLRELPVGVFDGLENLRWLDLAQNALTTLPSDVFQGLENLRYLDLQQNSLVELPAGIFGGLGKLTYLSLRRNELTTLPGDVFKGLSQMTELPLGHNSLRELPVGVFDGLENLWLLDLSANELSWLPTGVFAGLRLTILSLEGNPGAPFRLPLTIAAETTGESTTIRVEVEHGAPFAMTIELTAVNAGLSSPVATIPVGGVMSEEINVTPSSASWSLTAAGPGLPPDTWGNGHPRYEGFWIADAALTASAICSRTPQVRDAILSALSLTGCYVVRDSQLESVSALDLSRRGIMSLNADDFAGLTGLRRLILRDNALTTLPEGVFTDLGSLEVLDLAVNSFDSIPEGAFTGVGGLRRLFLHDNPGSPFRFSLAIEEVSTSGTRTDLVVRIEPAAPFELTIALDAENARLSSPSVRIPAGGRTSRQVSVLPIGGPWSLTAIAPSLPSDSYSGLEISDATLSSETAGASEGGICDRTPEVRDGILALLPVSDCGAVTTAQLEEVSGALNLRNRAITTLKPDDFAGLTALHRLDLEHNRLRSLPARVFDELGSLRVLRLGDNSLSSLPAGAFDRLRGLEELGLSGNPFGVLRPAWFNNLDRLTTLGLSRASLREAPRSVLRRLDLDSLALSGNFLTTLPQDLFAGQDRLRTLNLSDNMLRELPLGVFDGLSDLEFLDMSGNSLTTLPPGLFEDVGSLRELALQRNSLTTLPAGAFDGLGDLRLVSLYDNSLTTLPAGVFDGLDDLRLVSLYDNSLTTLPAGVFDGLGNLEHLIMYRNSLRELPAGVFDGLGNLRTVNLYDNSLGDLPEGIFDGLGSLERLVISDNSLSSLPNGVFEGLGNLRQVFLSENALESLREGLFQGLANLELLWLQGNPGAPFDFPLDIEEVSRAGGGTTLRVESAYGAPFPMKIELRAEGATVSTPSVTIPTGGLRSEDFTVTATGASWSVTAVGPPLPSTGFGGQYRGFIVTDGVFPPE